METESPSGQLASGLCTKLPRAATSGRPYG